MKSSWKQVGASLPVLQFRGSNINALLLLRIFSSYALSTLDLILGRSQVVRHRSLEPAFVGSNPPAPAIVRFRVSSFEF